MTATDVDELQLCRDCAGGAERCKREGGHQLDPLNLPGEPANGKRSYRCRRCEEVIKKPCCPRCGQEHLPAKSRVSS